MKFFGILKRYFGNTFIALDQLANTILAGDPDETISSRLGKLKKTHDGKIPEELWAAHILDDFLEYVDENHSVDAIEADEGTEEIWNWCDVPQEK